MKLYVLFAHDEKAKKFGLRQCEKVDLAGERFMRHCTYDEILCLKPTG